MTINTFTSGTTISSTDVNTNFTNLKTAVEALQNVQVEASTAGVGAPNVLTDASNRKMLTNEGSAALNYHTLPAAAAGLTFEFVVQDADGLRVTAAAGDTIRIRSLATAAAGYVSSATVGGVLKLTAINSTEWVATLCAGTWTDGTSSIVGEGATNWTSFTPTTNATNVTITGQWRRVGDSLDLRVYMSHQAGSTWAGGMWIAFTNLGLTVDDTKHVAWRNVIANVQFSDTSAGGYQGKVSILETPACKFHLTAWTAANGYMNNGGSARSTTSPFAIDTNDETIFTAYGIPITGWVN